MTELNAVRRTLLTVAAKRSSHSLCPLPDDLAPGALAMGSICALIADGLVEEREAFQRGTIVHALGEVRFGYFVTAAGLAAIGAGSA